MRIFCLCTLLYKLRKQIKEQEISSFQPLSSTASLRSADYTSLSNTWHCIMMPQTVANKPLEVHRGTRVVGVLWCVLACWRVLLTESGASSRPRD